MREIFGAPAWLPFSERVVSFAIWGIVLLHFIGVLPELRADLEALVIPIGSKQRFDAGPLEGHRRRRADDCRLSVAVRSRRAAAAEGVLRRYAASARSSSKVVRALLLAFGVLIALQAVGIDLTLLTVFGGALGVGIGLGLQKLASNYIAGFTILLDRSIRLGDVITVDNRFGVVAKVTSRYVDRAQPRRRGGRRAERDAGDDDRAQSFLHQPRRPHGAYRAGDLRQRHRARLEADGSGGQRRAARAEGTRTSRRRSSPGSSTAASSSSSASGSTIRKMASSTCESAINRAIWDVVSRERQSRSRPRSASFAW